MTGDHAMANRTDYAISCIVEHQDYPYILIVMCILSLFSVAGTVGNAFVIYVFSKQRDKPTSTIFIITLAATDFFTCLIIIPHTIVWEYFAKRVQYDVICKVYYFLITSNVPFSFFIMVAIAFDRYFKICRPWTHALDPPVAKRVIGGMFMFAVSLGIITSLAYGIYEPIETLVANSNMTDPPVSDEDVFITTPTVSNNSQYTTISERVTDQYGRPMEYYYGMCTASEKYINTNVRMVYQKFYASLFLIALILVVILYGLILKSIISRRAKKLNNSLLNGNSHKLQVIQTSTASQTYISSSKSATNEEQKVQEETQGNEHLMSTPEKVHSVRPHRTNKEREREKMKSVREKQRIANIKTAGILFIVTAVFIVAFLPSWLMAIRMIPANVVLFYMYFSYNVANPIIYAFFNRAFRVEMKNAIHCKQSVHY